MKNNRAAGEREGVRPASHFNKPPQKSLENQGFSGAKHFALGKMLGGRSAVKKVCKDFFDKLQARRILPPGLKSFEGF